MFYSHEILTNRKYGVATIWLAATMGSKSGKKLNRKAICNVDLRKACGTIIEPEAPMALRLSGNLLFGAVRVYSQQCGYVLQDAQTAHTNIRALFKVSRTKDLDAEDANARPDQLVRMDDPLFQLDQALPPLDFDFMALPISNDSQRSTQSMMSIRRRSGSVDSSASSMPGLNLPSLSSNGVYQLPSGDILGVSSAQKPFFEVAGDDEPQIYQDENQMEDFGFNFGADGNLIEADDPFVDISRPINARPQVEHGSDTGAVERVRQDHAGGGIDDDIFNLPDYGNDDPIAGVDDGALPENAEPFPERNNFFMSGGLQQNDQHLHGDLQDRIYGSGKHPSSTIEEETSSISAQAPQKKSRKAKKQKQQAADKILVVRSKQLHFWRDGYLGMMAAGNIQKSHHRAAIQARKNAMHFVYGTGIMGVGEGIGISKIPSPLSMFSGAALMAKITGNPLPSPAKGSKRRRDGDEEQSSSPKRARHEDEVGRDYEDQVQMMIDNDMPEDYLNHSDIEIGRHASSALDNYPSSAMMPWNVSASRHSHQRALSSKGPGSVLAGSVGHRLTSASPLIGRGSAVPGDLEEFDIQHEEDLIMYGRDDDSEIPDGLRGFGGFPSSSRAGPLFEDAEFEQFGPAAEVDTQTAGQSQWVRQALDKESNNFFEYVQNTILEQQDDELSFHENQQPKKRNSSVTFQKLFEHEKTTTIVAAQAFYHILTLATRNRLAIMQHEAEFEEDLCGDIVIRVKEEVF
ncbi:hypothetical protein HYALB_00000617 [Hymenoscyphus albidus]|uniref:Rad21/Rec8-like protein N-terminal domain-containing protein n=1 Tax=Hymenoscyphus albidus TaxID=595503 RepID=A0A9N9M0Y3_9HELO|nr:hypothetical protein HYALB_00000617 [Hymenoscyphus albidus]